MEDNSDNYNANKETEYWSSFYERNDFDTGSSFFEFLNNLAELPKTVIDIGCGQGRDSFAFARSGYSVHALDRSNIGIEHANMKTKSESLESKLAFDVCDVADQNVLIAKLGGAREKADGGNMVYYMRFFLHSIPEETQVILMSTIAKQANPGDIFAAEFRTDKDESHTRVFGDTHYRRFQNANDFSIRLQDEYGWNILFETEQRGLSPYGDEDPTLYRVVGTRPLANETK